MGHPKGVLLPSPEAHLIMDVISGTGGRAAMASIRATIETPTITMIIPSCIDSVEHRNRTNLPFGGSYEMSCVFWLQCHAHAFLMIS
jgi:hypothetical protein